jgi:hypothetical protein
MVPTTQARRPNHLAGPPNANAITDRQLRIGSYRTRWDTQDPDATDAEEQEP